MFSVYNKNGDEVVSDKSFPVIGRKQTFSAGVNRYPLEKNIAIGIYGRDILNGVSFYRLPNNGAGIENLHVSKSVEVVVFEKTGTQSIGDSYGLVTYDENGRLTFSSSDTHFIVESVKNVKVGHREIIKPDSIYCITYFILLEDYYSLQQRPALELKLPHIAASGGNLYVGKTSFVKTGVFADQLNWVNQSHDLTILRLRG